MNRASDSVEKGLLFAAATLGVALLIVAFASFPLGAYSFFSNQINGTSPDATFRQLYIYVVGVQLTFPVPAGLVSLGGLFFLLWATYIALFVFLLQGPWYDLLKALRSIRSGGTLAVYSNGALTWSFAFPVSILMAVMIDSLLTSAGVPIGTLPSVDARFVFWQTTYAPIVEEVGFRVTIVGVVAVLMALSAGGRRRSLLALWHPSRVLGSLGVESWKQPGIYAAIFGSAAIFGVAHVLGGWEIGKFFSSFAVGLAFGLLYYTHGLPLAVMMHWGFDYFGYSLYYFDQVRGLPPLTSEFTSLYSLQYAEFYSDVLVYMIGVALFVLALYVLAKAAGARRRTPMAAAAAPQAA